MTRGRSLVPTLFLLGVAALVLAAATPPPEAPPPGAATGDFAPPLAGGPAPDLNLVFTSQVVGWIEPCG